MIVETPKQVYNKGLCDYDSSESELESEVKPNEDKPKFVLSKNKLH